MFLDLIEPTLQTLYMVVVSSVFASLLGFPIGILLAVSGEDGLMPNRVIQSILGSVVNMTRSIPFIILMILLFPLTRMMVGKTIGTTATIVPLAIGAAPFVGRVIESALKEVDKGVIEAVRAMGASKSQIIVKVMLPEALPAIVSGLTLTIVGQIGYSAMAGAIGGGGLGDLAIRYGLHRYEMNVLISAVIVIVVLVQVVQFSGNTLANNIIKHR
ncbi:MULTISPECIES: methionine ABC transporter permease [unclassified Fusibacter]|uniref:methionine ABC transporter permease n=1 Tax=unclassified Fusibacter TaxID=2624464 RepID=UPI00101090E7|nr:MULTISPECIES: methionine ABC transporter permease [unclassified Fusibacter]MCK8058174.1 ABC transporter permease [Fusibacter sp. A2]NPE20757.1 ABC transporter permease [Fusibacter sp. A1]RXV62964.1 ABC transporter permease [Fusibacter sp. A1]